MHAFIQRNVGVTNSACHSVTQYGFAGLRIGYSTNLGFYEVDQEVARNTLNLVEQARAFGASVTEVSFDWGWDLVDAALAHLHQIFGTSIHMAAEGQLDVMSPYARDFAERGLTVSPKNFIALWKWLVVFRGIWNG